MALSPRDMDTLRVTKLLGLFGSGLLTGATFCFSLYAVPALHPHTNPPEQVKKQWITMYSAGKMTFPPFGVLTGGLFAAIAYRTGQRAWWVSAVATVAIVPYTLIAMRRNIKAVYEAEGERVGAEVQRWAWLNLGRAAFHTIAFATALGLAVR